MTPLERGYERTVYEAELEIDYAVAMADLHCRFFSRIKRFIQWGSVLSGSAVVTNLIGKEGTPALVSSIVMLTLSTYDLIFDLGSAAAAHLRDKQPSCSCVAELLSFNCER